MHSSALRERPSSHCTPHSIPDLNMRTRATITWCLWASLLSGASAMAQQAVPVRDLSAVDAKSSEHFGNIFTVRQLVGGKVLVNDGVRRRLVMLDDKLSNPSVVIDSVSEGGNSYGPRAAPLIPYLADSSLFVDGASLSLLVIDPSGKVAHVMSAPKPGDLRFLAGGTSGVDQQGNLIYRGLQVTIQNRGSATPGQAAAVVQPPDSAPILRANFETRTVDTVGRVKIQSGTRMNMSQGADGRMAMKMTVNPLVTVDDWAVLSDGTIAFVRGHDYHVDWIHTDGSKSSSAKLPFDWKRLTDDDKQKLIDSARTAADKAAEVAKANAGKPGAPSAEAAGIERMVAALGAGGGGGGAGGGVVVHRVEISGAGGDRGAPTVMASGPGGFQMGTTQIEFVPLNEIADYYPAIRSGAAKADLDGNLWILPTTSAQAKAGELIYDVVNNRGELFQRVRLPVGRSIAGFGRSGVVYLMYREGTTGWYLERTKILNNSRATF